MSHYYDYKNKIHVISKIKEEIENKDAYEMFLLQELNNNDIKQLSPK